LFLKSFTLLLSENISQPKVLNLKRHFDESLRCYKEGLALKKDKSDIIEAYLFSHLSQLQISKFEYREAKENAEIALEIIKDRVKDENYYDIYLGSVESILSSSIFLHEFEKGIHLAFSGVQAANESNNKVKEFSIKVKELQIHFSTNNVYSFEELYQHLHDFMKGIPPSDELNIIKSILYETAKLFYKKNEDKFVLILTQQFIFLKESGYKQPGENLDKLFQKIIKECDNADKFQVTRKSLNYFNASKIKPNEYFKVSMVYLEQLYNENKFEILLEEAQQLEKSKGLDDDKIEELKKYDS